MKARFCLVDKELKFFSSCVDGSENESENKLILNFELSEMDSWMLSDLEKFLLSLKEKEVGVGVLGKILDVKTVFQSGKFNVKLVIQLNDIVRNLDLEELNTTFSWEVEGFMQQGSVQLEKQCGSNKQGSECQQKKVIKLIFEFQED